MLRKGAPDRFYIYMLYMLYMFVHCMIAPMVMKIPYTKRKRRSHESHWNILYDHNKTKHNEIVYTYFGIFLIKSLVDGMFVQRLSKQLETHGYVLGIVATNVL